MNTLKLMSFGLLAASTGAFAKPALNCSLEMHQVDADAPWGMVGDSNQNLEVTLESMPAPYDNQFVAEQTIRFAYDQSEGGDRLSLHGVKIRAEYSEGNGLGLTLAVLQYDNQSADAQAKVLGSVLTSAESAEEAAISALNVGYSTAKMATLPRDANFQDLIKEGILKSGDLMALSLAGCHFSKE